MSQAHMNWDTGKVCHCPYAQHAEADPSFQVREASNLDQLKSPKKRPDLQTPEGQQWLNYLEDQPPKVDAIAPWMTREWKQGRLIHDPGSGGSPWGAVGYIPQGENFMSMLHNDPPYWADWHHSNHPNKEGVNIQDKNFQVPQMLQKTQEYQDDLAAKQREGYGEVVHQFPDNWSIRRLQNAEECSDEGKNMGHCAASYGQKVEDQANLMYSLRDPKNNPHATFDVTPKSWRNLDTGEIEGGAPPGAGYGNYVPLPHQGTFNQAFGKEDAEPLPEYKDRIKQFMETMPEEERPRVVGDETLGPPTPLDLQEFHEEPEAWQNSDIDAVNPSEYGLQGQSVAPDYSAIMRAHYADEPYSKLYRDQAASDDEGLLSEHQAMVGDHQDQGNAIYNIARDRGEIPELGQNLNGAYANVSAVRPGRGVTGQQGLDTAHAGMQQLLQPHWNPETGQYQNEPYQAPQAPQPQTSFSSKQAAGFIKMAAINPDFLQQWIEENGPYWEHNTHPNNVPNILKNGLRPWNWAGSGRSRFLGQENQPREDHVYLRSPKGYPADEQKGQVLVDLRQLDPNKFKADEGMAMASTPMGETPWEGYPNLGEWAQAGGLDEPANVQNLFHKGSIAYEGAIPPEAIQPAEDQQAPKSTLAHIFNTPAPPPKSQKLGNTTLEWEQTDKGAVMRITGHTHEDRALGRLVLASELARAGIELAQIPMDHDPKEPLGEELARIAGLHKEADWDDVQQKAKRLLDAGNVTLLRNGYNNVVSQVQGDHGSYQNEISRDDPNSRAITGWSCECLVGGEQIVMADGSLKNVEEISTGDLILTALGRPGIVGRTFRRHYEGQIVGLKPQGFTKRVWVTEDHKVPDGDYNFKEARHWREDDFSYLPQPIYETVEEIDAAEFLPDLVEEDGLLYRANKTYGAKRLSKERRTSTATSTVQKPIPRIIRFDEGFARLLGLFVAEGMVTPRGELRWSFHPQEEHLVDEVYELLQTLGFDGAYRKFARHAWVVSIQSKPLGSLFSQLVGNGAKGKRLHPYVMAMPVDALQTFFDAWFEGDGHEGQNQRNSLATASDDLAMQARLILARLERESCIRVAENNSSELVPGGTWINNLAWRRFGGRGQNVRFFYWDQVYQAMTAPETQDYSGFVYNFEVLDDHTYVIAPGIASANCPWDDYSFGRTRQWKKYEARPCAHTLASYWKSVSSPLDPDVDPKIRHVAPGTLPTQGEPGGGQGMGPGGETQPSFPGMTEREGQPPEPQPGDQTSLFDQAIQRTPSLQNALQALDQAAQPEDAGIIPPNPNLELPEQPQTPQPGQLAPGEVPPPNTISAPGARPITIQNPIQIPSTLSSWQEDNWKISDEEPTNSAFQSGDAVRLEEPTYGVAQGKSEEHGAGGWAQVPRNSIGEVRGQDPTTGWVEAHFPLNNSGPMEPYSVKLFLDPSQVSTVNNRSPFVKRR